MRKLALRQAAAMSAAESNQMGHNSGNYKQKSQTMRKRNGFEDASGFAGQSFGQDQAGLAGLMRQENARRRKMQMAANTFDEDSEAGSVDANADSDDADFNPRPGMGLNQAASGIYDGSGEGSDGSDGFGSDGGSSAGAGFGLDAGSSEHEGASFGQGGYDGSNAYDGVGLTPKSSYRQAHNLGYEESTLGGLMGAGANSGDGGRSSFSAEGGDDEGEGEED